MKKGVAFIIFLLIIAGSYFLHWITSMQKKSSPLLFYGTVQANEVNVSAKTGGKIVETHVREGDEVKENQVLALIEDRDIRNRIREAKASVHSARAYLSLLLRGPRSEEVEQAKAALQEALVAEESAKVFYERRKSLFQQGAVSKDVYDESAAQYAMSKTRVKAAEERLTQVQAGARKEEIEIAQAQLQQAQAALAFLQGQLEDARILSPIAGTVLSKNLEEGEIVQPGVPLFTLVDTKNLWVQMFVPEPGMGMIRLGKSAAISSNSLPGKQFSGKVSYIASRAEFTPKNVETGEERATQVFKIKIRMETPDGFLKPGMPVDVQFSEQ